MTKSEPDSPEVIYITMALIGLLAICVFVIAGLVLVVAKRRRREAGAPYLSLTHFREYFYYF